MLGCNRELVLLVTRGDTRGVAEVILGGVNGGGNERGDVLVCALAASDRGSVKAPLRR